jgi:hypothetical protein
MPTPDGRTLLSEATAETMRPSEREHRWDVCPHCGPMVVCGFCGNNCCNGGSNDGCPDKCASAYEVQRKGPQHPIPTPAGDGQ